MRSISSTVKALRPKVEKLVHLQEQLKRENGQLQTANAALRAEMEELLSARNELDDKYKALKLAKAVSGPNDKNLELKLKINELVREIDKCIALLNR